MVEQQLDVEAMVFSEETNDLKPSAVSLAATREAGVADVSMVKVQLLVLGTTTMSVAVGKEAMISVTSGISEEQHMPEVDKTTVVSLGCACECA